MSNERITIQHLHSYLDLVKQGKALPVLCPFDDSPTYLHMQAEPVFVCFDCHAVIKPGLALVEAVQNL